MQKCTEGQVFSDKFLYQVKRAKNRRIMSYYPREKFFFLKLSDCGS